MEKLADLPPEALVPFGIVLAIIFAVRHFGLLQGSRAGVPQAQVAAVIVDPSALNRLSEEIETLNGGIGRLVDVGQTVAKAQTNMATEIDRIREELRIQREISRNRER
ncbi:hypothetical protein [Pararhizobium sp.]|uniref:hypothetical protein n=1 Tax=Pararhizobium sp. TaxID=1977563 RepID=UPI00271C1F0E|nr:hypothetical protein [Pararhizobium sp.]MDO9417053.1 hypothetical protein [Pararhizobium sp.]